MLSNTGTYSIHRFLHFLQGNSRQSQEKYHYSTIVETGFMLQYRGISLTSDILFHVACMNRDTIDFHYVTFLCVLSMLL